MRRPDGRKRKELRESWSKVLENHGLTPESVKPRRRTFKPLNRSADPRIRYSDDSGTNFLERLSRLPHVQQERKVLDEEMQERETAARQVKHTIMPLHKGPYILVTDPSQIPMMGKKTYDGN